MDNPPSKQRIRTIVRRVLHALAREQAGYQGTLLTLFTGATAGFSQALDNLEQLMARGWALEICQTRSAQNLYGNVIKERLLTWPHAHTMETGQWLARLQKAQAVVVPMLSVSTLSRAVHLTPDTVAANILVHALLMGKPAVAAIDGAAPGNPDRAALGLDKGPPALAGALAQNLVTISDFGCTLAHANTLDRSVCKRLARGQTRARSQAPQPVSSPEIRQALEPAQAGTLVDAARVRRASRLGSPLKLAGRAVITPLAKELINRLNVRITTR